MSKMTRTAEYQAWRAMRGRCQDPRYRCYANYGGRGIKVCKAWASIGGGFEAFISDMGPKPSKAHTLDRIDNEGDYTPGNCRWATMKVQQRNRRNNRYLTFKGETRALSEWVELLGVSRHMVVGRLDLGWSVERALTEPLNMTTLTNRGMVDAKAKARIRVMAGDGRTKSDIAMEIGVSCGTITYHLKKMAL